MENTISIKNTLTYKIECLEKRFYYLDKNLINNKFEDNNDKFAILDNKNLDSIKSTIDNFEEEKQY